jgi:uncharacterized protein
MTRRRFLQILGGSFAGAAAIGTGGFAYATQIEPDWVAYEQVELTLPRMQQDFDGFRLVQISDIHLSDRMTGAHLADVVTQVIGLKPDLVAITGDFVDRLHQLKASLADLYAALKPLTLETQVVAVLGNHDYWTGASEVRAMLSNTGILELSNRTQHLERNRSHLWVAGVDDFWEGHDRIGRVIEQIGNRTGAAILLAHEPDYADISRATGRFDLQISGHSHGGQVVLPFIGPPVLPRYGEKYPSGLYDLGSMFQYTNRGLGTIPPRVRFNCRPEVTVFTLKAPTS